jgi:hypothetical protein
MTSGGKIQRYVGLKDDILVRLNFPFSNLKERISILFQSTIFVAVDPSTTNVLISKEGATHNHATAINPHKRIQVFLFMEDVFNTHLISKMLMGSKSLNRGFLSNCFIRNF